MSGGDETAPIGSASEGFCAPATADPVVLARTLGLSLSRLAALAGVNPSTLVRRPNGAHAQAALAPLNHLVAKMLWMGSTETHIARWFHTTPIPSLGPETPLQHVAASRIDYLEGHLENILNGVYA